MTGQLDRTLYVNNLLDRVQALERRQAELERLAGRPGTGPGQLAYYAADGSLYLGPWSPVVAVYSTAAGQTIPNNSFTVVNFEDQVIDTHGAVTIGATWHFTAPLAGLYAVAARVTMGSSATWAENEFVQVSVFVGGSESRALDYRLGFDGAAVAANYLSAVGLSVYALNAGDTVDVRIVQVSGGPLALRNNALHNHISIFRIQ